MVGEYMKAKDKALDIGKLLFNYDWDEGGGYLEDSVKIALATQAEISFNAGIKEVVDFMKNHRGVPKAIHPDPTIYFSFEYSEWQTKLKEWGIEC
jgi:hypothetical protein